MKTKTFIKHTDLVFTAYSVEGFRQSLYTFFGYNDDKVGEEYKSYLLPTRKWIDGYVDDKMSEFGWEFFGPNGEFSYPLSFAVNDRYMDGGLVRTEFFDMNDIAHSL